MFLVHLRLYLVGKKNGQAVMCTLTPTVESAALEPSGSDDPAERGGTLLSDELSSLNGGGLM